MTATADSELAAIFTKIVEEGHWRMGQTETNCGPGSTIARTKALRDALPTLFDLLQIEVLCDAPCGDANWIAGLTDRLRLYLGFDIVPSIVAQARQTHGARKNMFFNVADITVDVLPRADAILCRDCLVHLPDALVLRALARFKQSGSRLLLATTFPGQPPVDLATPGLWRPINLQGPPFHLPAPALLIAEGSGEGPHDGWSLGVWPLRDVPDYGL